MLTPEDAEGKIGVIGLGAGFAVREDLGGVDGGFAGWERSLNRTRVIRFFEGIVILFAVLESISDISGDLE